MQNFNLQKSRANSIAFVDYKPAELRIKSDWIIIYYAKNPLTQKLERQRLRAPAMSNKRERERHANRIVTEINKKLAQGWSPYLENPLNNFKTFKEVCEKFMEHVDKEILDGIKREDTRRAYASYISMLNTYIKEKKIKLTFALEINNMFAVNYLDWIYYERNNSPATHNNHLLFIHNLGTFMKKRGYIKENPALGIDKKKNEKKKRTIISLKHRQKLRAYLPGFNYHYYTLCMNAFYGLVRRTESTKLLVKDINLDRNIITLPKDTTKVNQGEEYATIPAPLKILLQRHLDGANANDYVFSANDFKPGPVQLKPKKITDTFTKIRKHLELPDGITWYSFKDSGITDLFDLGVPSIQIRDQARHKQLKTTEIYTPKGRSGSEAIKNSGVEF